MSQNKKTLKPLSLAIGAGFVASMATTPLATAATRYDNPFAMQDLHSGYSQVAEMKCGAGKCGSNMSSTKTTTSSSKNSTDQAKTTSGDGKNTTKTTTEGKCGGSN